MKFFPMLIGLFVFSLSVAPVSGSDFDDRHTTWDRLLRAHVRWIDDGVNTQVDYAGFRKDRDRLKGYLDGLSAVSMDRFQSWPRDTRLAFLLNAYNAFTVELILTAYPDLQSIRELRRFFIGPWKQRFFTLLGEKRHLDWIEHEIIREPGVYDDPRIHAAVNCASIGCPALRDEAYVAEKLDDRMEDQMRRFLRDKSRNRYDPASGRLEVSKIFDWYGEDFEQGHRGWHSLREFFADYADLLADTPEDREKVRAGDYRLEFLEYDWSLNNVPR